MARRNAALAESTETELQEHMEEHDATKPSFLDQMLEAAQIGEELIDPIVGKHDGVVLLSVTREGTEDNPYLTLEWSGITDTEGNPQVHKDRLFMVKADTHPIGKSRFMQKLKKLGVVSPTFKNVLYFDSSNISQLESALEVCIGLAYDITISKDNRDFYVVSIRKRL